MKFNSTNRLISILMRIICLWHTETTQTWTEINTHIRPWFALLFISWPVTRWRWRTAGPDWGALCLPRDESQSSTSRDPGEGLRLTQQEERSWARQVTLGQRPQLSTPTSGMEERYFFHAVRPYDWFFFIKLKQVPLGTWLQGWPALSVCTHALTQTHTRVDTHIPCTKVLWNNTFCKR